MIELFRKHFFNVIKSRKRNTKNYRLCFIFSGVSLLSQEHYQSFCKSTNCSTEIYLKNKSQKTILKVKLKSKKK